MEEKFFNRKVVSFKDINQMNTLEIAFVGDTVFELFVKNELVKSVDKVKNLTLKSNSLLNARSQKEALFRILPLLSENEKDVVMRGRNSSIHTKAKNFSIEEYRHATALETLVGYLYLTGQDDRLNEIFEKMNLFGVSI